MKYTCTYCQSVHIETGIGNMKYKQHCGNDNNAINSVAMATLPL
uniref:Uncharacterized protein n=1 Tax=Anguilla anguilla TaxID=7936 RepID=A0A0E9RAB1_ANGAN